MSHIKIHPYSRINRSLHRFLFATRQMNLLDGYGWNDGGCWTLAQALVQWSQGKAALIGVWSCHQNPPLLEHLAVKYNDLYLDADGIMTADELIYVKMADNEMRPGCYLAPVSLELLHAQKQIELDAQVVPILVGRLQKRFGNFEKLFSINSP